jgi:two-component system, OmpR family, alkaline phosphatase synthesis response regulator PhoP
MSTLVFLVEDDVDIAGLVGRHLERSPEVKVLCFGRGDEFLAACETRLPDLVILDLNLPDVDGLTLCRELRAWDATRTVPILMLTARVGEGDRVTGLDLGADDYLTKPFSLRELAARVSSLLRRVGWERGTQDGIFKDATVTVDPSRRQVLVNGREIHLTKREFDVLWYLISLGGRLATREQILDAVWGLATTVEERTVDAHIRTLRRKLGTELIETHIGSGYRFRREP